MKVLDVGPLHDGLRRNIMMLNRLDTEMQMIEQSIKKLVALEDSLKGEGGNAIRTFYEECHLPFLHFFATFQSRFISVLERMDAALESLEPDPSGFIRESYLEGEIEQGLTHIAQITESLTDEANSIMEQVADIIGLPHLDDSDVHEGVQRAKVKRNNTVSDLHEFDVTQTAALSPIETDLATMESWLANIESLFTDGTTAIDFQVTHWTSLSAENTLKTDLAHRTAEMVGVGNRTDIDGMPGTHLGTDSTSGYAGIYPTTYGNETTVLSGTSTYSLPGMATQSVPLYDVNLRGTSLSGSSAILTAGGRSFPSKVTSTATTQMEKPKQKKKPNKVFGFMKSAADFLILDDVKTVVDPNASLLSKGFAVFSATPAGKGLKAANLGFKLVRKSPFGKAVVKKVSGNTKSKVGPYSHLEDSKNVGPGKDFTPVQKRKIIDENKSRNGGTVKSDDPLDIAGPDLVRPKKSRKGVTPPDNEWQIDHILPKDKAGTNSYSNAQVLSRKQNRLKSNN